MLHLCLRVQLVPSIRAEFTLIDYFTVCVGPLSPHHPSLCTDSLFTESALPVSSSVSEHVVEEGGEVGLQLFMSVFSV